MYLFSSFFEPGGRLISLNKTSLEGVTFSDAAAVLQSSPDEVELIVSQPKRKFAQCTLRVRLSKSDSQSPTLRDTLSKSDSQRPCFHKSLSRFCIACHENIQLWFPSSQSLWKIWKVPWVRVAWVCPWTAASGHRPRWVALSSAPLWRNWRRPWRCPTWRHQSITRSFTFLLLEYTIPRWELYMEMVEGLKTCCLTSKEMVCTKKEVVGGWRWTSGLMDGKSKRW